MCPKTKTKSRTSTKESSKKRSCDKCTTRKVTEKRLNQSPQAPMPMPMPTPMMNQSQPGFVNYGYGYGGYGDWTAWEDNYPAMISIKQWRDHTQAAQNAYNSAQDNGKKIGEVKNTVTGDIRETQEAINETHDSVRDAHNAVEVAHTSIKSTHAAVLAVQNAQDVMNDKHAECLSKQEACAADVARVRQLLENEAKRREETRQVEHMVRYAQSQGLLQMQAQAPPDQGRDHRSRSSQSSSPTISVSSGRSRADEEQRIGRRRHWEREREHLEPGWRLYAKKVREFVDAGQDLQEHEQWLRARGELEAPRRKDPSYAHYPRARSAYYDDGIETPPYSAYSYAEHGVGPRGQLPRRGQPKCGEGRPWDY
ncbi:hypothetical protein F4678DRAFT_41572 [Xylaria arbuscula]|nr:hypothetical protein F4678DRAFT_41572 [Xylaria arbuscula]